MTIHTNISYLPHYNFTVYRFGNLETRGLPIPTDRINLKGLYEATILPIKLEENQALWLETYRQNNSLFGGVEALQFYHYCDFPGIRDTNFTVISLSANNCNIAPVYLIKTGEQISVRINNLTRRSDRRSYYLLMLNNLM